jgi:hypothetical protein
MENDINVEEEIRLAIDPSVFPNSGKISPAERFKMKFINNLKIKINSKLINTQLLVYHKKTNFVKSKKFVTGWGFGFVLSPLK